VGSHLRVKALETEGRADKDYLLTACYHGRGLGAILEGLYELGSQGPGEHGYTIYWTQGSEPNADAILLPQHCMYSEVPE
jgi:hypothetical protein